MSPLANFIGFQIGWLGCVLNAAAGRPLTGTAIALLVAAAAVYRARDHRSELALLAFAAAIGTLCDGLFVASTRLHYRSGLLQAPLPPLWDIALWPLFASTLNGALSWLKERLALAALLGAIGGPLAYLAAARLGAVELSAPVPTLVLLAVAWSVLTPLLLALARRLGRRTPRSAQPVSTHRA